MIDDEFLPDLNSFSCFDSIIFEKCFVDREHERFGDSSPCTQDRHGIKVCDRVTAGVSSTVTHRTEEVDLTAYLQLSPALPCLLFFLLNH